MSGPRAFGRLAESFAAGLRLDDPVIAFDASGAAEAVAECARRRFNNESFTVRPILPNEVTVRVEAVMSAILSTYTGTDERRLALDEASSGLLQVNGRPLSEAAAYDPAIIRVMQAAVRLSDGLTATSFAEYRRICRLLSTQAAPDVRNFTDATVPAPSTPAHANEAIVIWAPHLSAEAAAAVAIPLADLHLPILLISALAPAVSLPAQWVPLSGAHHALSRAAVIIDATAHGCESATALAKWSAPIVCDAESGAVEWLPAARVFDRNRPLTILEATLSAIGAAPTPPVFAGNNEPRLTREALGTGPLASIIIPTYDRPVLLDLALRSIERQTYANIETIVVIDGGPRIGDIEARHPSARFVYMEANDAVASCNTAYALASGKYVTFLNDDDLFFPNHVSELVSALERSGRSVAHGDVLTAFLTGSDGAWQLYGVESNMSRAVDRAALLSGNQIGMTSCLFRKDALDDEPFDEVVPLYRDYALWLKLSSKFDFVHVEKITSCYTIRNAGNAQQSTMLYEKALASYDVLYDRYPTANRPGIQARRQEVLAAVRQGNMSIGQALPAAQVAPRPWPLV